MFGFLAFDLQPPLKQHLQGGWRAPMKVVRCATPAVTHCNSNLQPLTPARCRAMDAAPTADCRSVNPKRVTGRERLTTAGRQLLDS